MIQSSQATPERLHKLKDSLSAHPGDCLVSLQLSIPEHGGTAQISLPNRVTPTENLLHSIERIFGEKVVVLS